MYKNLAAAIAAACFLSPIPSLSAEPTKPASKSPVKAALTELFEAGGEGSAASDEMGEKKQAAARAATRFLYMVVLYMAPVEQK